jgi:hypothetical protein
VAVQALYYGLGIIFMLGGAVAAYLKRLQGRVGEQEKALSDFKLDVAEHYAPQEFLNRKSPTRYATELSRRMLKKKERRCSP